MMKPACDILSRHTRLLLPSEEAVDTAEKALELFPDTTATLKVPTLTFPPFLVVQLGLLAVGPHHSKVLVIDCLAEGL